MPIRRLLFPSGKSKALTMSYDDGRLQDRRLVEIFNRHGIRGSFHLNSGMLDKESFLTSSEVPGLFANHETSAHSTTHPDLSKLALERVAAEILNDRRALEKLAGYPVRGMSYPYGTWSDAVVGLLPSLGIEYSRTTLVTGEFALPRNPLLWAATCHHNDSLMEKASAFLATPALPESLMYVWGHSYEFDSDNNWQIIESFCEMMGGRDDIWYATSIEIIDYRNAVNQVRSSADGDMLMNPSAMPVWVSVDGEVVEIGAGKKIANIEYRISNIEVQKREKE